MLDLEQTLNQKYPRIFARPVPYVSRPLLGALRLLFREQEINYFLNENGDAIGLEFVERTLEFFNFGYQVSNKDRENIPTQGRVIIVANHPLGALDALALIQLVSEIRPDMRVVANELLMHIKPLSSLLLPVDNLNASSHRKQIESINDALEDEQAVIVFPAGEVSRLRPHGVRDGRWNSGFLRFALRANAAVLPVHINARNSSLFYVTSMIWRPLAGLLLVQEMFAKNSGTIHFQIGEILPIENLRRPGLSKRALVRMVKRHVYRLGSKRKNNIFVTEKAIAHPQSRQLLKSELRHTMRLGSTRDDKDIYLVDFDPDSAVIKEIGRLRELSFRKVGEGSGKRRDLDRYDRIYRHLVLWDNEALEIAGAYRIGETQTLVAEHGAGGLYTNSLLELGEDFGERYPNSLELGRSFVQPCYWGSRALDYLWQGIGAYLKHYPHIQTLYGPFSISDSYAKPARDALVYYYRRYHGEDRSGNPPHLAPRRPYRLDAAAMAECATLMPGNDAVQDFRSLRAYLQEFGLSVPTLYKQYTDIAEPGGVEFLGFNVDPDFSNCIDGLICVDLQQLKPAKRKRYIDAPTIARPV